MYEAAVYWNVYSSKLVCLQQYIGMFTTVYWYVYSIITAVYWNVSSKILECLQ
jgi:hypothetical protein